LFGGLHGAKGKEGSPVLLLASSVEDVEQRDLVVNDALLPVRVLDRRVVLVHKVRLDELDSCIVEKMGKGVTSGRGRLRGVVRERARADWQFRVVGLGWMLGGIGRLTESTLADTWTDVERKQISQEMRGQSKGQSGRPELGRKGKG
jgi:hypothetical protein